MARIALAGFLHETNTFSRQYADFDAFAVADAWPGLVVGEALFDSVAGANLASAGFIGRHAGRAMNCCPCYGPRPVRPVA